MDRLKKSPFKMPSSGFGSTTPVVPSTPGTSEVFLKKSNLMTWIPLLCAGAAAGVSIVALKELKNVRNEIITLKKSGTGEEMNKRIKNMEEQLKILTEFIKESKNDKEPKTPKSKVIRNVEQPETNPPVVKIINNEEYEEVEVTDNEDSDSEN
jgi:hypothetical protein